MTRKMEVHMVFCCRSLGLNVILVSRTKEKLEQVAKEIHSKNAGVQVKTIAVDFTSKSACSNWTGRFLWK
jgi:short-subunit dehydrogenase